jgi:outer membrane protein OmpA-like peptidoglycan-associated protein
MQSSHMHRILVACSVLMLSVLPFVYAQETVKDLRDQAEITSDEIENALFPKTAAATSAESEHPGVRKSKGVGLIGQNSEVTTNIRALILMIEFASGSSTILPQSYANLDKLGQVLLKHPEASVEIAGHTDSDGSARLNEILSRKRAESVRSYLTQKFPAIDPQRLTAAGYGKNRPKCPPNDSPQCKAQNRRVEFVTASLK